MVESGMEEARVPPFDEYGRPDYSGALEYFEKAIARDPNFSDAYFLLAEYSMRSGNSVAAIDAYQKLITIPTFSTSTGYVYFDLAALELSEGYYEDGLIHSKKYATYKNTPADMVKENAWMIAMFEFAVEAKKHPVAFAPHHSALQPVPFSHH